MTRFRYSLELLLAFAGCCYAGYLANQELFISRTETAPTTFSADEFAKKHRGEQWVCVVGRVAGEHHRMRPSPYKVHRGKHMVYVMAPIVAPDWKPQQPVDVLATFGPMRLGTVKSWSEKLPAAPQPVQGQLRRGGLRNPQEMFPNLRLSPTCVIINTGTQPKHMETMAGFLLLMAVSGGWMAWRIVNILRDRAS